MRKTWQRSSTFFVIIDCRFQDRRAKAHCGSTCDLLLVPRTNENVLEERVVHADRAATQATRGGWGGGAGLGSAFARYPGIPYGTGTSVWQGPVKEADEPVMERPFFTKIKSFH
jgi:hypothetical protein